MYHIMIEDITDNIPITIPSKVKLDLSLFVLKELRDVLNISIKFIFDFVCHL